MIAGLANSVLTEIRGPGAVGPSGDTDSTGPVLWTGRVDGYLQRTRKTVVADGQQARVALDVFHMLTSNGSPVLEQAGPDWDATTIVIEDRRTIPVLARRFTVDMMQLSAAGTPVDSIRLELSGETTP
jgi:hypothetical protein